MRKSISYKHLLIVKAVLEIDSLVAGNTRRYSSLLELAEYSRQFKADFEKEPEFYTLDTFHDALVNAIMKNSPKSKSHIDELRKELCSLEKDMNHIEQLDNRRLNELRLLFLGWGKEVARARAYAYDVWQSQRSGSYKRGLVAA